MKLMERLQLVFSGVLSSDVVVRMDTKDGKAKGEDLH